MALAYGMPSAIVDGQDVFAVAEAATEAIDRARNGKGPTLVECKTLRYKEHDIGTPDLKGWEDRSEEEHSQMREREPVTLATERVLADKILSQVEIDGIHEAALKEIEGVEEFADSSEIARPSEEELLADVFVD